MGDFVGGGGFGRGWGGRRRGEGFNPNKRGHPRNFPNHWANNQPGYPQFSHPPPPIYNRPPPAEEAPPAKRPRIQVEDDRDVFQPVVMSFKTFLETRDDQISEDAALAEYRHYKSRFQKVQLERFFLAHCGEEWFQRRYHPVAKEQERLEVAARLANRSRVFWQMSKQVGRVRLDLENETELLELLDCLVNKLEMKDAQDRKSVVVKQEKANVEKIWDVVFDGPEDVKKETVELEENDSIKEGEVVVGSEIESVPLVTVEEESADPDKGIVGHESEEIALPEPIPEESEIKDIATDLHLTTSLFLKRLPPSVTVAELESLGSRFPGFLRASLSPPCPKDGFSMRAWITFTKDTRIKEVAYQLSGLKLGGTELRPLVNKDLSRRIRAVEGEAACRKVVLRDLKLAVELVARLDTKWGLDREAGLLEGVEELLAGREDVGLAEAGEEDFEVEDDVPDDSTLAVLDRVLLYLRVVHSVDWYQAAHYSTEDRLPHRLGLLHCRGERSGGETEEVLQYLVTSRTKLARLFQDKEVLGMAEVAELGAKVEDEEVDKFISANIEASGKEKWVCKLSGKKFRGEEFARKHVLNRFPRRLQEVRQEVHFYNSFLADSERPRLPDRPKEVRKVHQEIQEATLQPPAQPYPVCFDKWRGVRVNQVFDAKNVRVAFEGRGRGGYRGREQPADPRGLVDYSDVQDLEEGLGMGVGPGQGTGVDPLEQPHVHEPCPW